MKNFTVKSNCFKADYIILGNDIRDAIVRNFDRIHADACFGNAAGYRLISATAAYKPGILGGKGGAELTVTHVGQDLAHMPASLDPEVTTIWIHCERDDLPNEIELLGPPGAVIPAK